MLILLLQKYIPTVHSIFWYWRESRYFRPTKWIWQMDWRIWEKQREYPASDKDERREGMPFFALGFSKSTCWEIVNQKCVLKGHFHVMFFRQYLWIECHPSYWKIHDANIVQIGLHFHEAHIHLVYLGVAIALCRFHRWNKPLSLQLWSWKFSGMMKNLLSKFYTLKPYPIRILLYSSQLLEGNIILVLADRKNVMFLYLQQYCGSGAEKTCKGKSSSKPNFASRWH